MTSITDPSTATPDTEFNPDCEPAVFVAGFASEDPGVEQSAQTLFNLRPDLVQADLGVVTLNGESIEDFRDHLPANVADGVASCLKKCGKTPSTPNQPGAGGPGPGPYGPGNGNETRV